VKGVSVWTSILGKEEVDSTLGGVAKSVIAGYSVGSTEDSRPPSGIPDWRLWIAVGVVFAGWKRSVTVL
jgi:hypothetical protein